MDFMISAEALNEILGIDKKYPLTTEEMARFMNVTFYNLDDSRASKQVREFGQRLVSSLSELGANIVPYDQALTTISWTAVISRTIRIVLNNTKYLVYACLRMENAAPLIPMEVIYNTFSNRRRVSSGISVITLGELPSKELPINFTSSFRDTSIITIVDLPTNVTRETDFGTHFKIAMDFFAKDMTNVVLAVGTEYFVVYNFNASHPFYELHDGHFNEHILESLVPKVVAPIRPHRFVDFYTTNKRFSIHAHEYERGISEFVTGGKLFAQTNLYPKGKSLEEMPFRNAFYRWIGKIHLDNRNGMSYGFLAWQLPTPLSKIVPVDEQFIKAHPDYTPDKDYFYENGTLYIVITVDDQRLSMKVPEIWVLSQRSGSDKTNIRPEKDLIKMGLANGKMYLEAPEGLILDNGYKPSFDTKVILAHAVGNAIVASIAAYKSLYPDFVEMVRSNGLAIAHWHGYLNPELMPRGFRYYGIHNPHVSCSSPQSAIYALAGKIAAFYQAMQSNELYAGDIHIEPQHGSNINTPSIIGLAEMFINNPNMSTLGNKYLYKYK